MPTLQDLQNRISIASAALTNAIRAKWPTGTRVEFMRRHTQKNPSKGIVEWVSGEDVGVKYKVVDRYRGEVMRYKRIHWSKITSPR